MGVVNEDPASSGRVPGESGVCSACGLTGDLLPTGNGGSILLERLESELPSHMVPAGYRWLVDGGVASCPQGVEPKPGETCRISHGLVCPEREPPDLWPRLAKRREENRQRMRRMRGLPDEADG
ncbi:hypothetical protein GCM10010129_79860 [Streptomyces fumigatiscleroticus]|nr:hypothetical protein GCM10010129_79860 [Streptomyces fumigatiscleroticus]